MLKFIGILFIMFLAACSGSHNQSRSIDLTKIKTIVPGPKKEVKINQLCPVHMELLDSCLFFRTQSNCDSFYFHLYSLPDFKEQISFGRMGDGPDEFFEGELMYTATDNGNDSSVWVEDMNHKKFKKMDLHTGNLLKSISFPDGTGMLGNVTMVEGDCIIASCISRYMGSFFIYDLKTDSIKENEDLPESNFTVNNRKKVVLYQNIVRANKSNSRIVAAYQFFGQIDIFDMNLHKVASIVIKNDDPGTNWNRGEVYEIPNDAWHYFSDLQLTDHTIYALYNHFRMDALRDENASVQSMILKFNWDGDLTDKYVLPEKIDQFVVDDMHKNIICINRSDAEHPFRVYTLN